MDRRSSLKTLMLGSLAPHVVWETMPAAEKSQEDQHLVENKKFTKRLVPYQSQWQNLPDMIWTGEELWAQRLQDWSIRDGKLTCIFGGPDRTVHLLTHQLSDKAEAFSTEVAVELPGDVEGRKGNFTGFKLGVKGNFKDYRSAVIYGSGLNTGINMDGSLFIGQTTGMQSVPQAEMKKAIRLRLNAIPGQDQYRLMLEALATDSDEIYATVEARNIPHEALVGNIALISHFVEKDEPGSSSRNGDLQDGKAKVAFSHWKLEGKKVVYHPQQVYGPIYFAQYTLHHGILKLSAQLAPMDLPGQKAELELKQNGKWSKASETDIHPQARVAAFRVEKWQTDQAVPYRIRYDLPLKHGSDNGRQSVTYYYEGTIAAEPTDKDKVKALVLSCNGDIGFPHAEVPANASKHQADLVMFLGDQFYEANGGFGIQTDSLDKAVLDYLRKWYQFGWCHRELFRHVPSICLPDDHDVYHGNIWGAGGRATIQAATRPEMGDSGGYMMPAQWVNMAQITQTSHMPDPYDPTPVLQDITVYYTHWQYGGISFGIIEDRKFKSPPKVVLPEEAKVWNGYAENKDFNFGEFQEPDTATLIGDRQIKFIQDWGQDWSRGTQLKALVSATSFNCLQTLPKGTFNDQITPKLEVPEPGMYVTGDEPTRDMDSNGWPHKRRNEVLREVRKSFAIHLAGDQHLPSTVHYGVDDWGDSGFVFAVPAIGNIWPRRWWPPMDENHKHFPGQPAYTGNFKDGFGNRMTVYAVANPRKTGKEPAIVYDRVTGYGVVTFDKQQRNITFECWPRYVDPVANPEGQYQGWPIEVNQMDNYGRKEVGYLATLEVQGINQPVVQVIHEGDGEIEYTLRMKGNSLQPKVFKDGAYTVIVSDPDSNKKKTLKGMRINAGERVEVKV